jgi:DNA-binding NtrC family response regulator
MMVFLSSDERAWLRTVSQLCYCNPFLPERIAYERVVLGDDFVEAEATWNLRGDDPSVPLLHPARLSRRLETLLQAARERLSRGSAAAEADLLLYEDAVLLLLYCRYADHLYTVISQALEQPTGRRQPCRFYAAFQQDWESYFALPGSTRPLRRAAAHMFACFFQVRRAFHHIFRYLIGGSMAAARLRAAVWQSIFTHDMRRYRRTLYARMEDFTTLITGPSGTGKELVAQAIGLSRYVPFDPTTQTFSENFAGSFHALNLSALPSTLVESELFGHRRGAFTGAVQDRKGWLESCSPCGTVFLDEIGDLDPAIQVKLLRVLQTRTFQPLGETTTRHFHGKLIAATNRDLTAAMQQGQLREDFYYRLCSDRIVTPSLHEQLQESPEVLRALLLFLAQRIAGAEADTLAAEVETWIVSHLGRDYAWPGNIRELEQCLRNVLIRQDYQPSQSGVQTLQQRLAQAIEHGQLTADALLRQYCTLVYARTRSYEETARRVQLDRRTVKSRIDPQLLEALGSTLRERL